MAAALFSLPSVAQTQPSPSGFHIAIIDGQGALNNVEGRLAREPIVQVEDKNHKRVPGAYIDFDTLNLPGQPGAQFTNGTTHLTAITDASGRAYATGLRNNGIPGSFDIHVTVRYQGQVLGSTTIHQVNVCKKIMGVSQGLQLNPVDLQSAPALPPGIAAVAVGADMFVNGVSVPGNANLANGARLQTLANPVKLFVGNQCAFLVGPNSIASVNPNALVLEQGAARAEPFGSCGVEAHGLKVVGQERSAQGIVRIANAKLQVGAINGNMKVLDSNGAVKTVVNPCTSAVLVLFTGGVESTGNDLLYLGLGGALAGTAIGIGAATGKISTSP